MIQVRPTRSDLETVFREEAKKERERSAVDLPGLDLAARRTLSSAKGGTEIAL
jgi:hypothetical protein